MLAVVNAVLGKAGGIAVANPNSLAFRALVGFGEVDRGVGKARDEAADARVFGTRGQWHTGISFAGNLRHGFWEAASDASVIDVVGARVSLYERGRGEEVGVFARFGGIDEGGAVWVGARGDQREAAAGRAQVPVPCASHS